jgi:hypothetical protein
MVVGQLVRTPHRKALFLISRINQLSVRAGKELVRIGNSRVFGYVKVGEDADISS